MIAQICFNKNAFQWEAYRSLQWPLGGGAGVCPEGVSAQGVSAQGDCLPSMHLGGGGVCLPQCILGYTPSPNRITDACENITLPQLRCGR